MIELHLEFPDDLNDGWGPTSEQLTPILIAMKLAGTKAARDQGIEMKVSAEDEAER